MTMIRWDPVLEPALLATVAMVVISLAGWRFVRRRRVAPSDCVRIGAVLLLIVIAMGPMQTRERFDATPAALEVLVDASQSMAIEDERGLGRLETVRRSWLNVDALDAMASGRTTTLRTIGETSSAVSRAGAASMRPESDGTALHFALSQAINRGAPGDVILALTDGIETVEPESRLDELGALAAARSVRIDVVVPGSAEAAPDVRVIARAAPPMVFEGQPSELVVDVITVGAQGVSLEIEVREAGADGAMVHRQTIESAPTRRLHIPVRPRPMQDGGALYSVTVSEMSGEVDVSNNSRNVVVEVIDDAARVVVFEGRPYWETSFLIDAMRADPQIDVTNVMALTPQRDVVRHSRGSDDAPAPDWTTLGAFDVVVLGRGVERWFGGERAGALQRFVTEQGGAVLLLRGDPVEGDGPGAVVLRTIMRSLSPVEFGAGRRGAGVLGLTAPGRTESPLQEDAAFQLEAALADLPGVLSATAVDAEKALATVWLRQAPQLTFGERPTIQEDDPPALAVLRVGAGRTMAVLSDGLWRWAMAPQISASDRAVYGALWSRLIRWLALGGEFTPGRALSVDVSDGPHAPGDVIDLEVRARQPLAVARPTITVTTPTGETRFLAPSEEGRAALTWSASFEATHEGVYVVRAAGDDPNAIVSVRLTAHEHRREVLDITPRRERMQRMAEASGGRLWAVDAVDGYLEALNSRREARMVSSAEAVPLWDAPWVFALLVGLLGGAWLLDRWERSR